MSNKVMLILIGVLFVLVLGMGGGMFMVWNKLSEVAKTREAAEGEKGAEKPKIEPMGKVQSLETFIVNLSDPGGNRYLRVTMDLEVSGGKSAEEEVLQRVPQMRDAVLMILPSKRTSDLSSTEGKVAVREELLAALNGLLAAGKISRIYFKEFVIQ
jgi:flagellar FliL protein